MKRKEGTVIARKVSITVAAVLLWAGVSFAGKLVEEEGLNYYNEGIQLQKAGNFDAAIVSYQKAMVIGVDAANYRKFVYNNVGVIYAEKGEMDRAEAMFLEALKLDPEYKPANFNMAVLYMKQGLCNKAMIYLTKSYNISGEFVIEQEAQVKK
ncbi:MAG TPA: tetratricopeptide repeat protein [Candidatus Omnitrophota bacterium]|nr:tetratricopeptide repeat protein [Candidatus Omnitrophota bacterium]HNQ51437.1 tetratricopeptide repeat protein [Candidatus Omnitrophota bacterium]HQO37530.1 tetratricopeptide repeat protein [Candidatus Omnitrophota bacterium]